MTCGHLTAKVEIMCFLAKILASIKINKQKLKTRNNLYEMVDTASYLTIQPVSMMHRFLIQLNTQK